MKHVHELALAALAQLTPPDHRDQAANSKRDDIGFDTEVQAATQATKQENDGESVVGHGLGGLCQFGPDQMERQFGNGQANNRVILGNRRAHDELRCATSSDRRGVHLHCLVLPCVCCGGAVSGDTGATRMDLPGTDSSGSSADSAGTWYLARLRVAAFSMDERIYPKARSTNLIGFISGCLCLCQSLCECLDLAGPGFSDVAKPELLDGGSRDASRIGKRKNLLAGKLLQLGAERLNGRNWLIHPRILIHLRIERYVF